MEWWLDVLRSAATREPTVKIAPLCLLPLLLVACATAESPRPPPTSDADPAWWKQQGEIALRKARSWSPGTPERARNVILFVGDGMGVSTVTAARILEGQLRGERGEENVLSFEELPHLALSKTYTVNQQVSDSAPTMSAIMTGVKTLDGVLSVAGNISAAEPSAAKVEAAAQQTLLELAEQAGLSTGIVSTARITHATPGATYAHTPRRVTGRPTVTGRPARRFPTSPRSLSTASARAASAMVSRW
jgi:hypothetical protein